MPVLFALLVSVLTLSPAGGEHADPKPYFTHSVGRDWSVVEPFLPLPDSGSVANGDGVLRWRTPDHETEWVDLEVEDGVVRTMTAKVTATDLDIQFVIGAMSETLGEPSADGYFDITTWEGLQAPPSEALALPEGTEIQMGIFADDQTMVLRVTPE